MPESIRDIKRRTKSIASIGQITTAMKLVSAAKFRKAKLEYDEVNDALVGVSNLLGKLFESEDGGGGFLSQKSDSNKKVYVVITANRGFAGSFNTNVIKKTLEIIEQDKSEPLIYAVGTKGRDFFQKKGYEISFETDVPSEEITFLEVREVIEKTIQLYKDGEINGLKIIWTGFISSITYEPMVRTLLPFGKIDAEKTDGLQRDVDIDEMKETNKKADIPIIEYKPSKFEVMEYLAQKFIEIGVFTSIHESATVEHMARKIAMENASDNANDMLSELKLSFNRARQTAITNEILEIVSGAEALK